MAKSSMNNTIHVLLKDKIVLCLERFMFCNKKRKINIVFRVPLAGFSK